MFKELKFQILIIILLFIFSIFVILSFKPTNSTQRQSIVIGSSNIEKNPYKIAYDKCTNMDIDKKMINKCIEWEIQNAKHK